PPSGSATTMRSRARCPPLSRWSATPSRTAFPASKSCSTITSARAPEPPPHSFGSFVARDGVPAGGQGQLGHCHVVVEGGAHLRKTLERPLLGWVDDLLVVHHAHVDALLHL